MNGFANFGLALKERALQGAFIVVVGLVVTVIYLSHQTRLYSSFVQIMVDNNLDRVGTSGQSTQRSLLRHQNLIEQRALSEESLKQILDDVHEMSGVQPMYDGRPLTPKILSEAVQVMPIGGQQPWPAQSLPVALVVSLKLDDRELVTVLVNRIAKEFLAVDQTLRIRKAESRLRFHQLSANSFTQQLSSIESKIGEFKQKNAMSLPSAVPSLHSRISQLDTDLTTLDRKISSVQTSQPLRHRAFEVQQTLTLDSLMAEKELVVQRRNEISAQLRSIPDNERRLNVLERRKEQLEDQLRRALERVSAAEINLEMEATDWLAFLSVDKYSEQAIANMVESRDKILIFGVLASFAAAAAYIFAFELYRPAVRNASQIEDVFGIAPLVSISHISTPVERMISRLVYASLVGLTGLSLFVLTQVL